VFKLARSKRIKSVSAEGEVNTRNRSILLPDVSSARLFYIRKFWTVGIPLC